MVRGNNKGKRGERKICELLNKRFDKYGKFNRIPTSGAYGSTHMLSDEAKRCLCGDIMAPDPKWIFSLEIKTGYDIDLINMFNDNSTSDKKLINDFCDQSSSDAKRVPGRIPMVIYSKDRREPLCLMPLHNHSKEKSIKEKLNGKLKKYMYLWLENKNYTEWQDWIVLSFSEVLEVFEEEFFFEDK
jgi:hypothetical protein